MEKPHKQGLPDHKRCVNAGGNTFSHGFRGYKGEHFVLHDADETADEGDTVELVFGKFKGFISGIVGHNENMLLIRATPDALDERPLERIEDIRFVPLKEQVIEWYALASDEVAGIISGLHGVTADLHQEIGTLESRDDIAFAFIFHDRDVIGKSPGHCADGQKWNALTVTFGDMMGRLGRTFINGSAGRTGRFEHIAFAR